MAWYNPFSWIKRKDPRANYAFDDVDRQRSAEIKKRQAEIRKAEMELEHEIKLRELEVRKMELEDRLSEFDEEDDDEDDEEQDPADVMLMTILRPVFEKLSAGMAQPATTPPTAAAPVPTSMSDDQIRTLWNSQDPRVVAAAKFSTPDKIEEYLVKNYPGVDDDTIERAIKIIKEG